MSEEPTNREETGRNEDGTFKAGFSGNPSGRPKNTLKDYLRNKFTEMTEEEKEAFIKDINKETQWKMAEGNPHSTQDTNIDAKVEVSGVDIIVRKDAD